VFLVAAMFLLVEAANIAVRFDPELRKESFAQTCLLAQTFPLQSCGGPYIFGRFGSIFRIAGFTVLRRCNDQRSSMSELPCYRH
jgi:hypothetical protein